MATDELVALLVQVIQRPGEAELRRRAAELLEQRGLFAEALAVLAPLVNFTGHEEAPALPCLCKTCLASAGVKAETSGMTFTRAFAVSGTRVLHFWLADELAAQRGEVRRAVGEALRSKLASRPSGASGAGGGGASGGGSSGGGGDSDDDDRDDDHGDDDE